MGKLCLEDTKSEQRYSLLELTPPYSQLSFLPPQLHEVNLERPVRSQVLPQNRTKPARQVLFQKATVEIHPVR
jgi:hypothetical protein